MSKRLNNRKFGLLKVIEKVGSKNGRILWKCNCECGNIKIVASKYLLNNITKSCGCLKRGKVRKNLTGQYFGRWKVLKLAEKKKCGNQYHTQYLCRCNCGQEKNVWANNLMNGRSISCGCYKLEYLHRKGRSIKHGWSNTRTHMSWVRLKCLSNKNKIKLCDKWLEFIGFLEDMGEKPQNSYLRIVDKTKEVNKNNAKWVMEKL